MKKSILFFLLGCFLLVASCKKDVVEVKTYPAVEAAFGNSIDLNNLYNYANQAVPNYITKDNTADNFITDEGATLGRILFYDKNLSSSKQVNCALCHRQDMAFGDFESVSHGVNELTERHSMRLVNSRFADEEKFFWDERAATLEEQTTMPIRSHVEMGYSGTRGDDDINVLIEELNSLEYYQELFEFVFGDANVTEERMQLAMAQFVRSIQSFDTKYDEGRVQVANDIVPFPNFSVQENLGKELFIAPPQFNGMGVRVGGGLGCGGCHRAPEFDIDPNSLNNGFTTNLADFLVPETTITRSPSLRDVLDADGVGYGPFMHSAVSSDIMDVINHYNQLPTSAMNPNLDTRLMPEGNLQNLAMTDEEKEALVAFLKTLTGTNVYTDVKWSDPF